jgi:elongation factor G
MHANKREEIVKYMQDIYVHSCDLKIQEQDIHLCDIKNPIVLEKMEFPEPVIDIAIEPKSKADQEKYDCFLNCLWRSFI